MQNKRIVKLGISGRIIKSHIEMVDGKSITFIDEFEPDSVYLL